MVHSQYILATLGESITNFKIFLNILLFSYSHSDEPLFPCDLCGKKFWGKRQRTHHILATHENKRDHICTYCGKGFHTKAKMIRHSEVVSIVTTECYMLD